MIDVLHGLKLPYYHKESDRMMQNQREPYFKPLNTFELSSGKSQNRNRQAQNSNELRRQEQDLAIGGERLNSLHAKLHQEADKIRKWKNQTELDLKQKERKIQESSHTIDSLRKSILDLQLQNESLSMTLQEEMSNREDILQKVSATRNLCSVLKDHLTKTEKKLGQCEAEKTEIKYLEQEHKRQLEGLSEKFQELQVASNKEHSELTNKISLMTEERERLHQELKQRNKEAESQLKALNQQLDEKNIEIRDIRAQVQKNNDKIHSLEKSAESLKHDLKLSKDQHENAKTTQKELNKQLEIAQIEKESLEQKYCESKGEVEQLTSKNTNLQTDLDRANLEHAEQIQQLQSELEHHKMQLNQKIRKQQFLENDLDHANSLMEEVKSSKDMLIMEKAELQNRLLELEKQNAELLAKHEQDCIAMTHMTETINDLQGQLLNSQQDGANLMNQLNEIRAQLSAVETEKLHLDEKIRVIESEMAYKQTNLTDIQRELMEKTEQIETLTQQIQILQENLKAEQINHSKTQQEMEASQRELVNNQKEVAMKTKEVQRITTELENSRKKVDRLTESLKEKEKTEKNLREEVQELQSELTFLRENNESLLQEKQQCDEALQGKLHSKERAASELETKNKSLKSDITSKNKHIKELEKEIRSLKSKITAENKALENKDKELTRLQTDLETEISSKTELEGKVREQEENIRRLEEELKSVEKSAQEAKQFAEECLAEKDEMFTKCEAQRAEMSSIMLGYKTDLDKNLTWKDKELESLKQKLETLETKQKKETNDKVAMLNSQIEQLRKKISDSGYQMKSLQKNFSEKESKVQELKKQNMKKDEELRGLQEELEKMYIRSTTTTEAQTSPFPDKTYKKNAESKIPTPKQPPRTPQVTKPDTVADLKTQATPKTPQILRTPSNLKDPQRSILKPLSGNSATKKRRVVFAANNNDEESESGESCSFEVMDIENGGGKQCTTPLILKHSPKQVTPGNRVNSMKNSSVPLSRTQRAPPVDLSKKKKTQKVFENDVSAGMFVNEAMPLITEKKTKDKKEKSSSVRKAPNKSAGKFFKNSPEQRKKNKDSDMSWFENDDIFGFALED